MGRIKKKGNTSLGGIFFRYVMGMLCALAALGAGTIILFNILVNTGSIYPANYAEKKINESYDTLQSAVEVTQDIIPPLCYYAVFSEDGAVLSGNMPTDSIEAARNAANHKAVSGVGFYKVVPRSDGCIVLRYGLTPQYQSAFLREHFIEPQNLMTFAVVLGGIAIILLSSVYFGKKIKRKIKPIMIAAGEIKKQNLEYEVSYCGVREIDDCLKSIDEMRNALKLSLECQWKTEQEKSRQMSALAHDIKTPLSVVRGNAELLYETELTEEQKKYADYISGSAYQILSYVQTLIEMTRSSFGYQYNFEKIRTSVLLGDIKNQALGLAEVCHIRIKWKEQYVSETISVAYEQVVRAVMNVVKNAAEHTTQGGSVGVYIVEQGQEMVFTVEDAGSGFTKEALLHGTEQFFMDDESRGGGHYGIGLFFAKTTAQRHGGWIRLSNSKETNGAKVEICFRIDGECSI